MRSPAIIHASLVQALAEQTAALEDALAREPSRARALGISLRATMHRLKSIDERDHVLARATRLLAIIAKSGELLVRGFSAHRATEDPLASSRMSDGHIDVSRKLITGVGLRKVIEFCTEPGGVVQPQEVQSIMAGVTLRNANLQKARLSQAQLIDLDAHGADFERADISQVRFSRVNMTGVSLRGADLRQSHAAECDFSGADLTGAQWHDGTVARCTFAGASLRELRAGGILFVDCDLRGVDLSLVTAGSADTSRRPRFIHCDLRWACVDDSVLEAAEFSDCTFPGDLKLWTAEDEEQDTAQDGPGRVGEGKAFTEPRVRVQ